MESEREHSLCGPEVTGKEICRRDAQELRKQESKISVASNASNPAVFSLFDEDNDAPSENGEEDVHSSCSARLSESAAAPPRSLYVQVLWLLLGAVVTFGGAWFVVHFGTRPQLDMLEAKVHSLEQQILKQSSMASSRSSAADNSGVTVRDAPEAGLDASCPEGGQCRADRRPVPQTTTASGNSSKATRITSSGSNDVPSVEAKRISSDAAADEFPDLTCQAHSEWLDVKASIWKVFGEWQIGVQSLSQADFDTVASSSMHRLRSVMDKVDICGMGRLCMTLLMTMAQTATGSLSGVPSIHSPLMTVLLDVPWSKLMRSGWPLFGLLAQLSFRSPEGADLPVSEGPMLDYHRSLQLGLVKEMPEGLASLGAQFVEATESQADGGSSSGRLHVMPALCALASQLLGPDVLGPGRADAALQHMQGFFRQAVTSVSDLQGTMDSAWPLHSVLHAVSVRLMQKEGHASIPSG